MKLRSNYPWLIVFACFLIQAATTGIYLNCTGLYTPQIIKEFGFASGNFAFSITARTIATSFGMLMCPKVYNEKSFKSVYIISALICSCIFALQITYHSLWQ